MTYALRHIEAHMNSECDEETCPLAHGAMSDHRVHFRIDQPEGDNLDAWDSEACECAAGMDHDAGDEVEA